MEEEKLNTGINAETETANVENATNDTTEQQNDKIVDTPNNQENTFTQEQVNQFVRDRIDKIYSKYGVENADELEQLISKARSYETMEEEYKNSKEENGSLKSKLMFFENNIEPSREDDIRAYFKGKELELNEENLVEQIKTHPEWCKVVKQVSTIDVLGAKKVETKKKTDRELAADIFGYHF